METVARYSEKHPIWGRRFWTTPLPRIYRENVFSTSWTFWTGGFNLDGE